MLKRRNNNALGFRKHLLSSTWFHSSRLVILRFLMPKLVAPPVGPQTCLPKVGKQWPMNHTSIGRKFSSWRTRSLDRSAVCENSSKHEERNSRYIWACLGIFLEYHSVHQISSREKTIVGKFEHALNFMSEWWKVKSTIVEWEQRWWEIPIHARHSYSWKVAQVVLEFEIEKFSACMGFTFPVQPRKRPT